MNFNEVIKACSLASEKTQDIRIKELSNYLTSSLEGTHKPTSALVSFNLNHSERYGLVSSFTGTEIPPELRAMLDDEPACIIFDYSDTPGFLSKSEADDAIIFGLPSERLKAQRVAVIDGITEAARWLELSGEVDALCLLVNATMAMNQTERTWLNDQAKRLFTSGELFISITNLSAMNNEEDTRQVIEGVCGFVKRHCIDAVMIESPEKALEFMSEFLDGREVQDIRNRRVAGNVLASVRGYVNEFMSDELADDSSISGTITQLEKQRHMLELSGDSAADSVLANSLNDLKVKACEGIRDYGRQMTDSITSYIAKTPLERLERIDEKINSYIRGSWKIYFDTMAGKIDEEFKKTAKKLTRQMDIDAGSLIASLDEDARRTIYSALSLEAPVMIDGIRVNVHEYDSGAGDVTGRLRRETRNMMLLSIPLLFVNPVISAGNLVAAKLIERFRLSGESKHIREEISRQVEGVCFETTENIARQIQKSFDEEISRGSQGVRSAYKGLVGRLEEDITRLKEERDRRADVRQVLEVQAREVYPKLEAEINSGR